MPSCYEPIAPVIGTLCRMRSTPAMDQLLRDRLEQAVGLFDGGSADAFGRRIGYANGGYIREVLLGKKPVREALIDRVHGKSELADWFADLLPGASQRTGAESVAPPPPTPPPNFADRHEVSASDFALLMDVRLVMTDAELADLRARADRIRAIAKQQWEAISAGSAAKASKPATRPSRLEPEL